MAYDDSTRQLCLEVMVTMAEAAPAMVRRQALTQIAQLTPLILNTMADLDDDDDWANQDDLAVEDNDRLEYFSIRTKETT